MKKIKLLIVVLVTLATNVSGQHLLLLTAEAPDASFQNRTISICENESAGLVINLSGEADKGWYLIYTDGETQYDIYIETSPYVLNVKPKNTTTYTITSVSNGSCSSTINSDAIVIVNPSPVVDIIQKDKHTAHVSAISGNLPFFYEWDNGCTSITNNSIHHGNNYVNVIDVNGCSTEKRIKIK